MINILIIFTVSGLWHGASYAFIAWGLLHGIAMVLTRSFRDLIDRIPKCICCCFTFLFVNFAWIPFRAGSFTVLKEYLHGFTVIGDFQLSTVLCDSLSAALPIALPVPSGAWTAYPVLLLGLGIVFFAKNTMELLEHNKWKWTSAAVTIILLLLSVYSLSGTTSYLYLDF